MKYLCTGCDGKALAEYEHDKLRVPLCGQCHNRYQHADFSYQDQYCAWCGEGDDGRELFCCDTCSFAFCETCVERNFSKSEAAYVRDTDPWSCYICLPTPQLHKIKIAKQFKFYNIESAFEEIHPPRYSDQISIDVSQFSPGELKFISLMSSSTFSHQYQWESIVGSFLHARDIFSIIFRISKNIRSFFFKHFLYPSPGLFRTDFGIDHECRLYNHQLSSLQRMTEMENRDTRFGILRGGILADEPGLGKTVTIISLCLSTAGLLPKQPECIWDQASLQQSWMELAAAGTLVIDLRKLLVKVMKDSQASYLREILLKVDGKKFPYLSLSDFETDVFKAIRRDTNPKFLQNIALQSFRMGMIQLKLNLDKKSRSSRNSTIFKRMLLERNLRPSGATLIVVPLVLLEHWYEQLTKHVGLEYLSEDYDNDDCTGRGVIYIDGLGDIVDVQAPLPRLALTDKINAPDEVLANYLFVLTTFERCESLQQYRARLFEQGIGVDNDVIDTTGTWTSPLLSVRWFRLVVDEGHEITTPATSSKRRNSKSLENTKNLSAASLFIHDISAERRWVMSGTPTTGTNSIDALQQLQTLLSFLRHGVFGLTDGKEKWDEHVVNPYLARDPNAWDLLISTLKSIMIRHTKDDLRLDDPVQSLVVLDKIRDPYSPDEEESRYTDRAFAKYVGDTIDKARDDWIRNRTRYRRPKAIIFSQHKADLEGVGHFLYLDPRFGDRSVCEHDGIYRSAELSRFRHSKKKFRTCPLCGHNNTITSGKCCDNILVMVEYVFNELNPFNDEHNESLPVPPAEAGHSALGRGGHFTGRCLCSPGGCKSSCNGFINALGSVHLTPMETQNPNLAIVDEKDIAGWTAGRRLMLDEMVFVTSQPPCENGPLLWRQGRLGGLARVLKWAKCGGMNHTMGYHGSRVLAKTRWEASDEDASILLLHTDGSHGLDLSFATHLFLLEKIKDPSLERQIISRAHRMGATGPCQVVLLQTKSLEEEKKSGKHIEYAASYWTNGDSP